MASSVWLNRFVHPSEHDAGEGVTEKFLEIKGLTKRFGGLIAVNDLDLVVNQGEIVGLIGPNGAGKSTVFNLITGFLNPTDGVIHFEGMDITKVKPHKVAKLGIGRTFQLNPLFGEFTVLQNIIASFYLHPKTSLWGTLFHSRTYRRNEAHILDQSMEIVELLGLDKVKEELAKNLPQGYQKMLGIARALATKPKLLLLDEPVGGMNGDEIDFTMGVIEKTRKQGITILLVEHNMKVMDIVDRVTVINFGQKIAEGTIEDVREDKQVMEAYFGVEHTA
jgi:branched-chain amino acid transport system ATP-binding protein